MTRITTLSSKAERLVELIVRHASVADWQSVEKYEAELRRCRSLLAQSQTPGF